MPLRVVANIDVFLVSQNTSLEKVLGDFVKGVPLKMPEDAFNVANPRFGNGLFNPVG